MVQPDGPVTPLSSLLAGIELSGLAWCYVDLAADGGFSLPPVDGLCFHAVLHGAVRLAVPGGEVIELAAGEGAFLLRGEAHALRASSASPAPPLAFLREEAAPDAPPSFLVGNAGPAQARVLSTRLSARFPSGVERSSLPATLRVALGLVPSVRTGAPHPGALRGDAWATAGAGAGIDRAAHPDGKLAAGGAAAG